MKEKVRYRLKHHAAHVALIRANCMILKDSIRSLSLLYGCILALSLFYTIGLSAQVEEVERKARPECWQNRAAFQFGPYTTRMVVAEINICENHIGKILTSWELSLPFEDYLQGEDDKRKFPEKFLRQAINAIWLLRKKSDRFAPQLRIALVSPLLKRVTNGPQLLNYLEHVGKLRIVEAEPREIALMNYHSVVQVLNQGAHPKVAVWDIGASQMSLVVADTTNNLKYYIDNMASITFRNWMISDLKKEDVKKVKTPNPIGPEKSIAALDFVKEYAKKKILPQIRHNMKNKIVIGVGGVHNFLLGKWEGAYKKIDRRSLGREIRDLRQYTDRGMGGGRFASTKVSNMIMVLGHMESLGLEEYYVVNTSPLVGLLLMDNL